jgi:hypothetical protein
MAKNSMRDLQNHLFLTMEKLLANNDPDASPNEKIDLPTAKAICQTASVIIDSAKAENEYLSIIARASNPNAVMERSAKLMLGERQEKA